MTEVEAVVLGPSNKRGGLQRTVHAVNFGDHHVTPVFEHPEETEPPQIEEWPPDETRFVGIRGGREILGPRGAHDVDVAGLVRHQAVRVFALRTAEVGAVFQHGAIGGENTDTKVKIPAAEGGTNRSRGGWVAVIADPRSPNQSSFVVVSSCKSPTVCR